MEIHAGDHRHPVRSGVTAICRSRRYTSDIVNVGIQQGGIEDQIPEAISVEEMDRLLLFVPEDDQQTVLDAYDKDDSTYDTEAYVLKSSVSDNEDEIGELEDLLQGPMMLVSGFESGSDMTKQIESQIKENLPPQMVSEDMDIFDIMEMLPQEQRDAMTEKMSEQLKDMPDSILEQAAVSYVRSAYENVGMDMDRMQTNYLLVTGGKMAALAFLGMAASVTVGFPGVQGRSVHRTELKEQSVQESGRVLQ